MIKFDTKEKCIEYMKEHLAVSRNGEYFIAHGKYFLKPGEYDRPTYEPKLYDNGEWGVHKHYYVHHGIKDFSGRVRSL